LCNKKIKWVALNFKSYSPFFLGFKSDERKPGELEADRRKQRKAGLAARNPRKQSAVTFGAQILKKCTDS
jgi:hypothetical protein